MGLKTGRAVWLIPGCVAAAILAAALSARPSLDGHEVLVAQTAREMLASGDWVHPTFSGEPRLLKPPLAYWLTAACYATFGVSDEVTARLPSAIATILGVLVLTVWTARIFGRRTGVLAGFFHATTFATLAYGRMSLVDAWVATFSIAAAAVASWDRPLRNATPPSRLERWATPLLFWSLVGLNALAKGPVGPAIVLPAVLVYRLSRGRRESDRALVLHPSFAIGFGVCLTAAAGWGALIVAKNPHVLDVWREQSLSRFLVHWGPQTRPWYYYFYTCSWLLLPWTPLAVLGLALAWNRVARRGMKRAGEWMLLLAWFGTAFLLCSASAGKRPHYVLAGLPALSVLSALAATWVLRTRPNLRLRHSPRRTAWAVVGCSLTLFGFVLPRLQHRTAEIDVIGRHQTALTSADVVAQFGSRDHWSIFPVGRTMAWPRDLAELDRCTAGRRALILTPRSRLEEIGMAIRVRELDPHVRGSDKDALVLVERVGTSDSAGRPAGERTR